MGLVAINSGAMFLIMALRKNILAVVLYELERNPADYRACCDCADAAGVPEWAEDWRVDRVDNLDQNSGRQRLP